MARTTQILRERSNGLSGNHFEEAQEPRNYKEHDDPTPISNSMSQISEKPDTFGQQSSDQTNKRKRGDMPQRRERSKRLRRTPVSYADPEDTDDSAFYESDEDGEGIVTRKIQKPKADRPLPKRKIFPFLSLPRELRDIIYDYALGCPTAVETTDEIKQSNKSNQTDENDETDGDNQTDESNETNEANETNDNSTPTATTSTSSSNVVRIEEIYVGFRKRTIRVEDRLDLSRRPDGTRVPWRDHSDDDIGYSVDELKPAPLATGLLAVCRQVRAEAAPVLYGGTRFRFANSNALLTFVARLSRGTRGMLRDVRLLEWYRYRSMCQGYDKAAFELLADGVTGVKAIQFPADSCASDVCRNAWPWLEAIAREREGGLESVLEMLMAGIEEWGDEYQVGGERRTSFAEQFMSKMTKPAKKQAELAD
ncbi:hypothetical protein DBV05_g5084 [Lasiodiplodia theobromae]|uniref:Uncharacterized protein n=1 Tax=Lasiodiplodia theobromae TaxID=45133 RepID=A0A5N5DEN4_9PEZI|nr:hypothetical protein DBV05_g5084 [Lasiodiplodia theobromae]